MRRSRPLHRQVFIWFGAAIFATGLASMIVFGLIAHFSESSWEKEVNNLRVFTGHIFEEVWDEPEKREHLSRMIATHLNLQVTMRDQSGVVISRQGLACDAPKTWSVQVADKGSVELCAQRSSAGPWKVLIPLLVLAAMLWTFSHRIARRLTRPLREVTRVAKEIGDGNLEARPKIGRHTPTEVRSLADSIHDMAARIGRQLDDQRVLLASVSHELRTPLGHLRILTELARSGETEKALQEMETEIAEIDELVGQLLDNARLDFKELDTSTIDVADLAGRALARRGLPADLLDATSTSLVGDPALLGRALANLVDNAEKHGTGLTRLTVTVEGEQVTFAAEDRGPGLPAHESLFGLFRSGTREHGNLGLGLFLVRRIAEAHGGKPFAENRDGGGARIGFSLPRVLPPEGSP